MKIFKIFFGILPLPYWLGDGGGRGLGSSFLFFHSTFYLIFQLNVFMSYLMKRVFKIGSFQVSY